MTVIVDPLGDVTACGFVPILHTIFGGECSVGTPVSSMFQILSGLFKRLFEFRIVPSSW